jgi:ABC-type antimicrobial peptide transport system permease subunit
VAQRKAEMGIRVACGARPIEIIGLVLSQHLRLVGIGLAVGVVGSLLLARAISTFLYRTQPTDPLTFAAVIALVIAVGVIACWLPASRAARTDPMRSLRTE